MADLEQALTDARAGVQQLNAAAERCAGIWTVPRAPGKWSPSQIVEHVARSFDESAKLMAGRPAKFPTLPFFVRPLVRRFVFDRVVRTGVFPRARTNPAMNPASGPPTPAEGRTRLEAAFARFEEESRRLAASGHPVPSRTFGDVGADDYARFMAFHTRHHSRQMPA